MGFLIGFSCWFAMSVWAVFISGIGNIGVTRADYTDAQWVAFYWNIFGVMGVPIIWVAAIAG